MAQRTAALLAVLTAAAAALALQLYVGYRSEGIRIGFAPLFVFQLAHWYLWALWGPLVWRLAARWPLDAGTRQVHLRRHAITAPLVCLGLLVLLLPMYLALSRLPPLSSAFATLDRGVGGLAMFLFAAYFHVELLVYGGIVAAAQVGRERRLLAEKERQALSLQAGLADAKLQALRAQLQPHFLFNTLHTIGSLVLQRQNERALSILAELGELLRVTLARRATSVISLEKELSYLRSYVSIEQTRFGDRVTVEWAIHPETLGCLVPTFILQPVVENAFKHGVARRAGPARLRIEADLIDGSLRVQVHNDGPQLPAQFSVDHTDGYGLSNVRQQLNAWHPKCELSVANADVGVSTTLTVPPPLVAAEAGA